MADKTLTTGQANAGLAQGALDMVEDNGDYSWAVGALLKKKQAALLADALCAYMTEQWGAEYWDEVEPLELWAAQERARQGNCGSDAAWRAYLAACDLYAATEELEREVNEFALAVCELCGLPEEVAEC